MEVLETNQRGDIPAASQHSGEEEFTPTGAIAFFIALVALGLIIWFGIYFLMLDRL